MLTVTEFDQKIVGYGGDGAAVNVGQKGGVISHFRSKIWDGILMMVCLIHRLECEYKDAMKKCQLFEKVMRLLSGLYTFYHTSPLQRSNLKTTFETCKITGAIPLRVGGTRWRSHTIAALDNLWKAYPGLVRHLEQAS